MSTKRRLQLMPEVLPTPQRVEGRADPRARIMERMRQLAAAEPAAENIDDESNVTTEEVR
jgi:hypothetical protein